MPAVLSDPALGEQVVEHFPGGTVRLALVVLAPSRVSAHRHRHLGADITCLARAVVNYGTNIISQLDIGLCTLENSYQAQRAPFQGDEPWETLE
jgi:hypothetical protein